MELSDWDRACLSGAEGEAAALAMKLLVRTGEISGATRMIDVSFAHIDGGLYHGRAGLDFAARLAASGGKVRIPTTLNVASLDLIHPDLYRGDGETAAGRPSTDGSIRRDGLSSDLDVRAVSTARPSASGEHIAWAESTAIVFANSVLGARTDRYGDFLDISAALTGRVPEVGLHQTDERAATIVFNVRRPPERITSSELFFPVLGHLVGRVVGSRVPAIEGLTSGSEDDLKAFGAAAASSGAVALFHAIGITPEAPTIDDALQGKDAEVHTVNEVEMTYALRELSTAKEGGIDAISVGTPHMSVAELERLDELFGGRRVADTVAFYASTGRDVLRASEERGLAAHLAAAGVRFVTDTCTYITPILPCDGSVVMTDSAKWAYYASGNLGVEVVFASISTCVETTVTGERMESDDLWD